VTLSPSPAWLPDHSPAHRVFAGLGKIHHAFHLAEFAGLKVGLGRHQTQVGHAGHLVLGGWASSGVFSEAILTRAGRPAPASNILFPNSAASARVS